jgi:hypothetical protein
VIENNPFMVSHVTLLTRGYLLLKAYVSSFQAAFSFFSVGLEMT